MNTTMLFMSVLNVYHYNIHTLLYGIYDFTNYRCKKQTKLCIVI